MDGTVQQEFRAAGNGTELADYQPLVVDTFPDLQKCRLIRNESAGIFISLFF